eukprot:8469183-Heterocapsa_arctica.AAC.1
MRWHRHPAANASGRHRCSDVDVPTRRHHSNVAHILPSWHTRQLSSKTMTTQPQSFIAMYTSQWMSKI